MDRMSRIVRRTIWDEGEWVVDGCLGLTSPYARAPGWGLRSAIVADGIGSYASQR